MKITIVVILHVTLFSSLLYSQTGSINNTLGTGGIFTIKDASTTFFSLSQSNGYLDITKSLNLPLTTDSSLGVIFKGTNRFIHNYTASGTQGFNTFVGVNAGNFTMAGTNIDASYNTSVGVNSLNLLTSGYSNSALGYFALYSNTTGYANSALGYNALYSNTIGTTNSALGYTALGMNTTGNNSSAFGYCALNSTTTASYNSAFGSAALFHNTGANNSAFGATTLFSNTTGVSNSAFGYCALYSTTGNHNSAFGDSAGRSITSGSNNTCIGYNAQVPNATSDNQVRIGDATITYAGIEVAWTVTSDKRWKSNIAPSDLGLNFVSKLKPVSYTRKNDERHGSEYGFIAQDVEEVLKEAGVANAGMLTVDDKGKYELRYNDLLAPMVKAIQELKTENDALRERVSQLEQITTQNNGTR